MTDPKPRAVTPYVGETPQIRRAVTRAQLVQRAADYNAARNARDAAIREAVNDCELSRREIAAAVRLSKSRVDQIARGYGRKSP